MYIYIYIIYYDLCWIRTQTVNRFSESSFNSRMVLAKASNYAYWLESSYLLQVPSL